MKTFKDLYFQDNAWKPLKSDIDEAKNQVVILPCNREEGTRTLEYLQVTNKSSLGAIALETGGLLIDYGWIRILGSGHENISGSLVSWNNPISDSLLIGYDVIGGFFALEGDSRRVYYFAPDTLDWEDTGKGYTDFISWTMNGNLDLFYQGLRWDNWVEYSLQLMGDQGFSIYPYLWTKEGNDIERASKSLIPIPELWELQMEIRSQLIDES